RLQQCRTAMEPLAEQLERRRVVQCVERGLVRKGRRNVRGERARDVSIGERIHRQWRRGAAGALQALPRVVVQLAGGREVVGFLKRGERALKVLTSASVDLAGREPGAIERDLRRERFTDDRRLRGGAQRQRAAQQYEQ